MFKQFMAIRLNTLERSIHGLKTALACLLGFVVTKIVHSGFDQWLVITIIVVMCAQLSVGSMLQKSYMRILGTVAGSIIAMLTIELFGTAEIPLALAVTFSAMIFSFIATSDKPYSDAGALGAVTVAIILVGKSPTLSMAGLRFVEITLGIGIAALVSSFIFPIHAKNHLRRLQAKTIRQLGDFYENVILKQAVTYDKEMLQDLDENIIASLLKQRKLTKEVDRELFNKKVSLGYFKQILGCERNILRCINFIILAEESSSTIKPYLLQSAQCKKIYLQIHDCFNQMADCLAEGNCTTEMFIIPTINSASLLSEIGVVNPSVEESLALNAILFLMQKLLEYLRVLSTLIVKL